MSEILIIHYNTPELTEAAVRSVRKYCGEKWHVTIFDNSDKRPFWKPMDGVTVLDNTKGQLIDFEEMMSHYPDRCKTYNDYGSAKHCKSVDYCFDILKDGFVLMDSDVVLKQYAGFLVDKSVAWSGMVDCNTRRYGVTVNRVLPFLCWINVPMLREHGIRYFNGEKMWKLTSRMPDRCYDTGAWMLAETTRLNLPAKELPTLDSYIEHFHGGSWRKGKESENEWLTKVSKHFIEDNMAKKSTAAKTARKKKTTAKAEETVLENTGTTVAVEAAETDKAAEPLCTAGEEGIDIVVPMVFPNDSEWLKLYREACRANGREAKIDERVRSWSLERYFFRGIAKNMPWIRKIHLIVASESQVPFWLRKEKVHIVLHKDIMPESVIPTFNSSTIEMWLHNIEGLSEQFIYCNDDMIAVSPLEETDFFIDGKPVVHCAEQKQSTVGDFYHLCKNVQEMASKDFGKTVTPGMMLRDGHSYAPMLLSVIKDVVKRHGKEMADSCTTFRANNNLNQYLYTLTQWFGGKCVDGHHTHRYYSISSDYDKMTADLLSGVVGVACFNDGGIGDWREMVNVLFKVMQRILGEKCEYEI